MKKAIALALKGQKRVYPNPRVGALIVEDATVISEGYHEQYGGQHAEKIAIDQALRRLHEKGKKDSLANAVLYCTLEPCCDSWKGKQQPPCTEAILASGIRRIVLGTADPNPRVRGRGIAILRRAGIAVEMLNALHDELLELNEVYFHLQKERRPFVHVKIAQSLDAHLAAATGDSKWITGTASRSIVHSLRSGAQAILTGINTVLVDNPRLDLRFDAETVSKSDTYSTDNPVVVVLDSELKIPEQALVFQSERYRKPHVILFCLPQYADAVKIKKLKKQDATVIAQDISRGREIDLHFVLKELEVLGIVSILVEAGPKLLSSFFAKKLVDKLSYFIAPKIIGGEHYVLKLKGSATMQEVMTLHNVKVRSIVNPGATTDVFVSGYTKEFI